MQPEYTLYEDVQHRVHRLSEMLTQLQVNNVEIPSEYDNDFLELLKNADSFISAITPLYNSRLKYAVVESFFEDCQDIDDICRLYDLTLSQASHILREGSRNHLR